MRKLGLLLLLIGACSFSSFAQLIIPDFGSITGNVYENKFLGLSWEFPADWQVQNDPSIHSHDPFLLLQIYPGGTQSGESVVVSYVSPSVFDEDAVQWFDDKLWKALPPKSGFMLGGGIPLHREDYQSVQESMRYLTCLTGPRRDFGIKYVLIANTSAHMEEMIKVVSSTKVQPDWPSDSSPTTTPTVPLAQRPRPLATQPLVHPGPIFPQKAFDKHIEGGVVLFAEVDTAGKISRLYVERGNPILVPSAIKAASQWRYQPYIADGKPTEFETKMIFTLKIGDSYYHPTVCDATLKECIKQITH